MMIFAFQQKKNKKEWRRKAENVACLPAPCHHDQGESNAAAQDLWEKENDYEWIEYLGQLDI